RGKFISISEDEQKEVAFGINQEFRCLKRTDLIKAIANCLPMETIRTSCQVVSIELDSATHYPQLLLSNGSILQAKSVIPDCTAFSHI
ncbi:3-hydroxybenzoate 6-hydroxylase 1-like protein, partial [Trifolium pratense]